MISVEKPFIEVINALGNKTTLEQQNEKKFIKSVAYINSFITKNKNASCVMQLQKYKPSWQKDKKQI